MGLGGLGLISLPITGGRAAGQTTGVCDSYSLVNSGLSMAHKALQCPCSFRGVWASESSSRLRMARYRRTDSLSLCSGG